MQIREVEITPIKPQSGLIGFASCVLDNAYYISSIGIFTKVSGGYRLVYPTKKIGEKSFDIHHPINQMTAKLIEEAILEKVKCLFGDL